MKLTTITVRIPVDLKKSVADAAKAEDRSLTKVVVRALKSYLEGVKRG